MKSPNFNVNVRRSGTLMCAAAAGLIALGVLVIQNADHEAPAVTEPIAGSEVAVSIESDDSGERREPVSTHRGEGVYSAPVGTVLTFALNTETATAMTTSEDATPLGDDWLRLNGEIRVVVAARRDGEMVLSIRCPDLSVDGSHGPGFVARLGDAGAQLSSEFLVRMDVEGRILGYRFGEEQTNRARYLARGIAPQLRLSIPLDTYAEWSSIEADSIGRFEADYTLTGTVRTEGSVRRHKRRYLEFAGGAPVGVHELAGEATAKFSCAAGWLEHVRVDEAITCEIPDANLTVRTRVATTLKLTSVELGSSPADVAWGDDWASIDSMADAEAIAASGEEDVWRAKLKGVGLNQLVDAIQAAIRSEDRDSTALHDAWRQLAWLFRLRPDAIEAAMAVLASVDERAAGAVVSALGRAGTTQAQAALLAMFGDPTPNLRRWATMAMFQIDRPATRLVGAVAHSLENETSFRDGAATSLLALGTLAARCRDPLEDGRTAFEHLLALEGKSRELGSSPLWLQALGNTHSPAVVDRVVPYLGAESELIRLTAISVLIEVDAPSVVAPLAEVTRDDGSPAVRRAAIFALGKRLNPDGRRVLEVVASTDASAELRELARKLLATVKPS